MTPPSLPSDEDEPRLAWVVLKIAQRCNLNCSYCYVYNRGDDSWRDRPVFISDKVVRALGQRIVEQCRTFALPEFVVELHGGEPLLFGKRRLDRLVRTLREQCGDINLRFVLQTNGLLLDEEWLELFDRHGIRFGVSIDGPAELADRRRVRHNGLGSTEELLQRIRALRAQGPLFDRVNGGALCVINPDANGAELVKWFAELGFRGFDFLLPDGNYVNLPQDWTGPEPYRRFLIAAFEQWYGMGADAPRIRMFELMMRGFFGAIPVLDALGGDLRSLCVVETNGSIGVSDVARICGGQFAEDSLNVFDHPLRLRARQYGLRDIQRPCTTCSACPFLESCGGGYLPHRFDGASFDNPSLYCNALYGLAEAIYRRLREDVPAELWRPKERPRALA